MLAVKKAKSLLRLPKCKVFIPSPISDSATDWLNSSHSLGNTKENAVETSTSGGTTDTAGMPRLLRSIYLHIVLLQNWVHHSCQPR